MNIITTICVIFGWMLIYLSKLIADAVIQCAHLRYQSDTGEEHSVITILQ